VPRFTGRIYDRSRPEGDVVNYHSFDIREESVYGLLAKTRTALAEPNERRKVDRVSLLANVYSRADDEI
jgi:hypothetical protein